MGTFRVRWLGVPFFGVPSGSIIRGPRRPRLWAFRVQSLGSSEV